MNKFYGKIGYVETVETEPGVWSKIVTERTYYGDVLRNTRRYQPDNKVNDGATISLDISIVSDTYADENFFNIRYVEYKGAKWEITNIDSRYPRLVLSLGGLYLENEE